MRLLYLFVTFNLILCTTGLYSAADLFANESQGISSHCHEHERSTDQDEFGNDSTVLKANSSDDCYNCCLDVVTASHDQDNYSPIAVEIALSQTSKSNIQSYNKPVLHSILTIRKHGPPDLFTLHSSYLL